MMKPLLPIIAGIGVIAFVMSFAIRVLNMGSVLKASSEGWWRASIGILAIGILFALIELVKEQTKMRA